MQVKTRCKFYSKLVAKSGMTNHVKYRHAHQAAAAPILHAIELPLGEPKKYWHVLADEAASALREARQRIDEVLEML